MTNKGLEFTMYLPKTLVRTMNTKGFSKQPVLLPLCCFRTTNDLIQGKWRRKEERVALLTYLRCGHPGGLVIATRNSLHLLQDHEARGAKVSGQETIRTDDIEGCKLPDGTIVEGRDIINSEPVRVYFRQSSFKRESVSG